MSHPLADLTSASVTPITHSKAADASLTTAVADVTETICLTEENSSQKMRLDQPKQAFMDECQEKSESKVPSLVSEKLNLLDRNALNESAPPNLLNSAFASSLDSESLMSASQTSLSESSDICSVDDYDSYSGLEPSNSKKDVSNMSPSSSTSSLSNPSSYCANSCSSSPKSNTASFLRRNSGAGKTKRNSSHRMSFPLAQQAKAGARNVNGGTSPFNSTETVGE